MKYLFDQEVKCKSVRKIFASAIVILLASTFALGCAVERHVKHNRFYSSYPKAIIDVDKKFTYLGSGKYNTGGFLDMEHEFFAFSEIMSNRTIQRGLVLDVGILKKFHRNNVQLFLKVDDSKNNIFDHGYKEINGKQYEYFIICESSLRGNIGLIGNLQDQNETDKWLYAMGYMLPRCGLQQRIISLGADLFTIITYVEDATLSGFGCSQWYYKNQLTETQKQYINDFAKRADQAIKAIDF